MVLKFAQVTKHLEVSAEPCAFQTAAKYWHFFSIIYLLLAHFVTSQLLLANKKSVLPQTGKIVLTIYFVMDWPSTFQSLVCIQIIWDSLKCRFLLSRSWNSALLTSIQVINAASPRWHWVVREMLTTTSYWKSNTGTWFMEVIDTNPLSGRKRAGALQRPGTGLR